MCNRRCFQFILGKKKVHFTLDRIFFFFLPSLKVRFVRCDTLLFVFRTRRESDDLMEDIIARRRLMEVSDDFITRWWLNCCRMNFHLVIHYELTRQRNIILLLSLFNKHWICLLKEAMGLKLKRYEQIKTKIKCWARPIFANWEECKGGNCAIQSSPRM